MSLASCLYSKHLHRHRSRFVLDELQDDLLLARHGMDVDKVGVLTVFQTELPCHHLGGREHGYHAEPGFSAFNLQFGLKLPSGFLRGHDRRFEQAPGLTVSDQIVHCQRRRFAPVSSETSTFTVSCKAALQFLLGPGTPCEARRRTTTLFAPDPVLPSISPKVTNPLIRNPWPFPGPPESNSTAPLGRSPST